jgi:hypothetical protein
MSSCHRIVGGDGAVLYDTVVSKHEVSLLACVVVCVGEATSAVDKHNITSSTIWILCLVQVLPSVREWQNTAQSGWDDVPRPPRVC